MIVRDAFPRAQAAPETSSGGFFRPAALAAALGAAVLAPAARAAEATDSCTGYIDSLPAVLTSPGYYCLRADEALTASSGTAITIASDDVTIDCNDFKLNGLAAGDATNATAFGATGFWSNPAIRRCVVRGFRYGTYLFTSDTLVEDSRFDENTDVAILLQGRRSRVRRNHVTNTGGSTLSADPAPIAIWVGSDSEVSDNTIDGVRTTTGTGAPTAIRGWDSYQPTGSIGTITGNRISGMERAGGAHFWMIALSGGAVVSGNRFVAATAPTAAGAVTCNTSVFLGNGLVVDNTLSGFTGELIGACIDGGGNVSL
jgi:hypothetical protein